MLPARPWSSSPARAGGKIAMPNVTRKLSSSPGSVRWPGPETLGEHNEEVYSSLLKLDREALDALRRNGTI